MEIEFPVIFLATYGMRRSEALGSAGQNRQQFGNTYHESDFVFTWPDGTLISPNYLTRMLHKTAEQKKSRKSLDT